MKVSSVFGEGYSVYAQGNVKVKANADLAEYSRKSRSNQRDTLEISGGDRFHSFYSDYGGYAGPEEFGNSLRYRYSHTIVYTATGFLETAGEALQEAKGEKEEYDGSDVVNSYGFAYGTLYGEIEKRYEDSKEQWFDMDGTPLTREKEMVYLDTAYENAVAFQVSSARVMAGLGHHNGQMQEATQRDIDGLKNVFYRSRDRYKDLYEESKATGEPMNFHRFSFGNSALLALLV